MQPESDSAKYSGRQTIRDAGAFDSESPYRRRSICRRMHAGGGRDILFCECLAAGYSKPTVGNHTGRICLETL